MPQKPKYSISERKLILRIIDVLVFFFSIFFISQNYELHYFKSLNSNIISWFLTLCVYILFFGQIFELYSLKVSSSRYLVIRSIGVTSLFVTVFYIFTPIISPELPISRMQILYLFLLIFVPVTIWRFLYISLITLPKYHKYILLIGQNEELENLIDIINKQAPDNKIVGYVAEKAISELVDYKYFNVNDSKIRQLIDMYSITEIVVSKSEFSASKKVHNQLIYLFENGVSITSARKFVEKITSLVPDLNFNDSFYDYLNLSKSHESNLYLVTMRTFDIIVSLFGVMFLTLALPLVLIGNLLGNRGKLFYFQDRVGKKGEVFNIIKLRTMVKNAETDGAVWAEKNDNRITAFGKFLRKTRLDEVPQFINILRNDMSLIGPRPERPEFVKELEEKLPYYAIRHVVKPGLTGWAQVMFPYANTVEEQKMKLRYDLFYIKERGLFLDFKICIKTINTVLFFKGQ
jgi:exopolysaccharide biosynthesis polyprenyl glycosylphosphotransferase